jgi:hypothetical protein
MAYQAPILPLYQKLCVEQVLAVVPGVVNPFTVVNDAGTVLPPVPSWHHWIVIIWPEPGFEIVQLVTLLVSVMLKKLPVEASKTGVALKATICI